MNLADVRRMLNILPRYNRHGAKTTYRPDGLATCFSGWPLSRADDRAIKAAFKKHDPIENDLFSVREVDTTAAYVVHIGLKHVNLVWLAKSLDWQKWRGDAREEKSLPIVLTFGGKLVLWNGHHRSLICRMLGVKLRCRYVDFDKIMKAKTSG